MATLKASTVEGTKTLKYAVKRNATGTVQYTALVGAPTTGLIGIGVPAAATLTTGGTTIQQGALSPASPGLTSQNTTRNGNFISARSLTLALTNTWKFYIGGPAGGATSANDWNIQVARLKARVRTELGFDTTVTLADTGPLTQNMSVNTVTVVGGFLTTSLTIPAASGLLSTTWNQLDIDVILFIQAAATVNSAASFYFDMGDMYYKADSTTWSLNDLTTIGCNGTL